MGSRYHLEPPAVLLDRRGNPLRDAEGNVFVLQSITLDTRPPDDVEHPPSPVGTTGAAVVVGEQQQTSLGLDAGSTDSAAREKFDPVKDVWDHYCSVMQPRNRGLDPQARAIIRDALKVATLSECKRAIDGCKASDFHMGRNDRSKKYNRLSQILKGKRGGKTTREQIDMFLEIADKSGVASRVTSADPAKVNNAKRDVIDAFDFPGDEHIQARGSESRRWLEEVGFEIGQHPETGRPTFKLRGEEPA